MPRKPFTFTQQTARIAYKYCKRRFNNDPYWPVEDYNKRAKAKSEFDRLQHGEQLASELLSWCRAWLVDEDFTRLRGAVRRSMQRLRRLSGDDTVTVELSREAWLKLSTLAKHNNLTLSEYLTRKLAVDYDACLEDQYGDK